MSDHPHRITEAYGQPEPGGTRWIFGMVEVAPPDQSWLLPGVVREYAAGLLVAADEAEKRNRLVTEEEARRG